MDKKKGKDRVTAVILTGGSGSRMETYRYPKQFIRVLNKPIFIHTLQLYEKIKEVDDIVLVINKRHEKRYTRELRRFHIKKLSRIVSGGIYRQYSILNALKDINHDGLVVLQNGINATTPSKIIRKCIKLAKAKGAASAFVPAFHTIFIKGKGRIKTNIARDKLGYTCEPQVCKVKTLKRAFECGDKKALKDIPIVALLERSNKPVALVLSDMKNFKITIDSDLKAFEHILKKKSR